MRSPEDGSPRGSKVARIAVRGGALAVVLAAASFGAYQLSPWPSALFYRYLMDKAGINSAGALQKYVPTNLTSWTNQPYGPDRDSVLDVFYPWDLEKTSKTLPAIVWIHGGGFISGGKDQIANYLRVIAGKGYVVIGVNYRLAPSARYPEPLHQVNTALAFLMKNMEPFHIDRSRIILAGDSAGAQIAAQMANIVSVPLYAKAVGISPAIDRKQLAGTILHCGLYDAKLLRVEGSFAGFLQAVGWSYFGEKDFHKSRKLGEFSVVDHVTADYPPVFITAGNADPLLPHSLSMAERLEAKGVAVDRLFFASDHKPPLGHEYQFNLDTEAGRLALERTLKFLASLP